jgi:glycosyltransferase involved in cell wall biosynthesis
MWPSALERLSGRGGIVPSLKKHKWLYFVIPFFLLAQTIATIRTARKLNTEIIHAHWLIPQGFTSTIAGRLLKKPVIVSIHGSDVSAFRSAPALAIKRFAVKSSRVVVANSSDSHARLNQILQSRTYPTIPVGVVAGKFTPHNAVHSPVRILFIGRLSEAKGVADLIDALALLKQSSIPFKALVAGTGPLEVNLKRKAEKKGLSDAVDFIGWVARDDIDELYDWTDVFVGPSISEALGVVFIEAGMHGVPVVSTKVGGIPDIVLNNKTGITVSPNSPQEIADAIRRLVDNPDLYRSMGKAAYKHVVSSFAWDSVIPRYSDLYEQTVNDWYTPK